MKIPISFKSDEIDLYNFLKNKRSPSIYIKDILEKEMENNNSNVNKNDVDNSNFEPQNNWDF